MRELEIDIHFDSTTGNGKVFRVYHLKLVDQQTSCSCLENCLNEVDLWSKKNPDHSFAYIWIEPRGFNSGDLWCDYPAIAQGATDKAIDIIKEHFEGRIIIPDDIRTGNTALYPSYKKWLDGNKHLVDSTNMSATGEFDSLTEALRYRGWPQLGEVKGKFMFVWNFFGSNKACREWYLASTRQHILFQRGTSDELSGRVESNYTAATEVSGVKPDDGARGWMTRMRIGSKPENPKALRGRTRFNTATIFDFDKSPIHNVQT